MLLCCVAYTDVLIWNYDFTFFCLIQMVGRQKPSQFPFCDICKLINRKHREASSKCLDCAKLLCRSCVTTHRETKVNYISPECSGLLYYALYYFIFLQFLQMVIRVKPSKFPFCDICKLVNRRHREAHSKCLDCVKLLCKNCVELHKSTKVPINMIKQRKL